VHFGLRNTTPYGFTQRTSYAYIVPEMIVPGHLKLDVIHFIMTVHNRE
jgi:hypothetical protein